MIALRSRSAIVIGPVPPGIGVRWPATSATPGSTSPRIPSSDLVSPTSSTGYSALGVPEGPHIAPANSENCIQLKAGDCAPRTLLIRAPFFSRFDIGVTKRFPIHGAVNFEFRVDVLNLFDNINFDPVANPGSGDTIFQVNTAYRDPDNNFDPGGRLGQLSFRINW